MHILHDNTYIHEPHDIHIHTFLCNYSHTYIQTYQNAKIHEIQNTYMHIYMHAYIQMELSSGDNYLSLFDDLYAHSDIRSGRNKHKHQAEESKKFVCVKMCLLNDDDDDNNNNNNNNFVVKVHVLQSRARVCVCLCVSVWKFPSAVRYLFESYWFKGEMLICLKVSCLLVVSKFLISCK
jgi:hypothetical protein